MCKLVKFYFNIYIKRTLIFKRTEEDLIYILVGSQGTAKNFNIFVELSEKTEFHLLGPATSNRKDDLFAMFNFWKFNHWNHTVTSKASRINKNLRQLLCTFSRASLLWSAGKYNTIPWKDVVVATVVVGV